MNFGNINASLVGERGDDSGTWVPDGNIASLAEISNESVRQTEYYAELWNVINWIELKKREEEGEDVDPTEKLYANVSAQFTDADPTSTNIKSLRDNPAYRTRYT